MTALRPGLDNPTFWGGYVEVGMLVTGGDTTAYKGGAFDRIKPTNPVSEGGIGAIQLNARYDRIDLNDGAIVGGIQEALGLSAIWIPTDYVRFLVNYGHLWVERRGGPGGHRHRLPGRYLGHARAGRFLSRGRFNRPDVTAVCRESVFSP